MKTIPWKTSITGLHYKAQVLLVVLLILCFSAAICFATDKLKESTAVFPEVDGWSREDHPSTYTPETLYEYINGAADLYLTYDFQELLSLNYEKGEEQGLTVDIYRHSSLRNGFGIYSQERPTESRFLPIGTQGYYEQGILNFVLGSYYVKLAGFYLGEEDEALLTHIAREVAARLKEKPSLPTVIGCFPDSGKVDNSERYAALSFLGHGFLHSAYTAEYEVGEQKFRLFILEADDEAGALKMLESYLKLARDKGERVNSYSGSYRFKDPYYGSSGKMNLRRSGRYIWGLFSDNAALYEFYLDEIGRALKEKDLIGEVQGQG